MPAPDVSRELAETVRAAWTDRRLLSIRGHGTKQFCAPAMEGAALDATAHRGIVAYEPTELVLTARAGTALADIEAALAENNQMLGFEPPHFGSGATLGGTLACGLSGPRRPYAGSARDFVLGMQIVNGKGEILRFGGQVMKNVAGYDVSRLMVGSHGTLGLILEASLKVLPKPPHETTLRFAMGADEAILKMNTWAGQPYPVSAACHSGDALYVRLSGSETAVRAACIKLGGEAYDKGNSFFEADTTLWRLSVPPAAPMLRLSGKWMLDWGGAQRWLHTSQPAADVMHVAEQVGGHAQRFRDRYQTGSSYPAGSKIARLHELLKQAFDPGAILNCRNRSNASDGNPDQGLHSGIAHGQRG
jgi:glycolate oxidase FAD binding subunit